MAAAAAAGWLRSGAKVKWGDSGSGGAAEGVSGDPAARGPTSPYAAG